MILSMFVEDLFIDRPDRPIIYVVLLHRQHYIRVTDICNYVHVNSQVLCKNVNTIEIPYKNKNRLRKSIRKAIFGKAHTSIKLINIENLYHALNNLLQTNRRFSVKHTHELLCDLYETYKNEIKGDFNNDESYLKHGFNFRQIDQIKNILENNTFKDYLINKIVEQQNDNKKLLKLLIKIYKNQNKLNSKINNLHTTLLESVGRLEDYIDQK